MLVISVYNRLKKKKIQWQKRLPDTTKIMKITHKYYDPQNLQRNNKNDFQLFASVVLKW